MTSASPTPLEPESAAAPPADARRDKREAQVVQPLSYRALVYVVTGLVAMFVWCWLKTLRLREIGPPPPDVAVYATWHRALVYAIFYWRWRNGVMMASASKDGEWAAGMIRRFGNRVVRGSSSRGGKAALDELVGAIRTGASGGLLPDAPRGPARKCKPGILALAQRTGVPIVPVQFAAERCLRLRSWDRTIVPYPFSRIVAIHGAPFPVAPDLEGAAFDRRLAELEAEMNRLADQADAYFTKPPGESAT